MHRPQLVTFIIPTFRRFNLLKNCIQSINNATSNLDAKARTIFNFKIHVIYNGQLKQERIERELSSGIDLPIEFSYIAKATPAKARNSAIRNTESDYFYFIDDDTTLPSIFIEILINILVKHSDVDIFGGPDAAPENAGYKLKALALALQSPLTTLKTRFRHVSYDKKSFLSGSEKNLILCNLCVKSDVFKSSQTYFPEDYFRNEENQFLNKVKLTRLKVLHFPSLYIHHHRNTNFFNVYKAASRSAFYRTRMFNENFKLDDLFFVIPAIFVIYLLSLPIQSPIPLIIYIVLNLTSSATLSFCSKRLRIFPIVSFYQFLIVFSYGIGMIKGIALLVSKKTKISISS